MGFSLIFYGLNLMTSGLKPLRKMPEVLEVIQSLDASTFGGVIACVLLAARQPPAGVGIRLPDLASRFASSLVMQLQTPDDTELSEVLHVMADQRGLELGPGVAAFLLRRVRRDTHQLAVLMERLDAAALAAQRALTVPFVREVIGAG
jgi:chromosomal replication initiation ATPase DnaA